MRRCTSMLTLVEPPRNGDVLSQAVVTDPAEGIEGTSFVAESVGRHRFEDPVAEAEVDRGKETFGQLSRLR